MCGIVGYIGKREAYPIILNGLKRLEYRGYDSAGVAIYDGTEIQMAKTKGKVVDFSKTSKGINLQALIKPITKHFLCYPKKF